MDKISNPFSPGAGTPPPSLAGRDNILESAEVLFGRILKGRSEKSLFLTGLRGVGKTVLLNEIKKRALKRGYLTAMIEVAEQKTLADQLIPEVRRILFELNDKAKAADIVRKSLGVLRSFINAVKVTVDGNTYGIDIDPEFGSADSGDLEIDLTALFIAIGNAAKENATGIAFILDEVQYLHKNELAALIAAMHKMQQEQLPVVIVGAGLPTLHGLLGSAKSYAERLFNFPQIGPLSEDESIKAIQEPIEQEGAHITPEALEKIFIMTQGYPYFLQEWGYQSWNTATASPIDVLAVEEASQQSEMRLDVNFFKVRFDRLTRKEKEYLRAMAELGPEQQRTSDIAAVLGAPKVSSFGSIRDSLIKKGMIYSPEYGHLAFTVPLFDKFMLRTMPQLPRFDS